jgi:glycosyltransferase involved in cell wall biosynthesis
MDTPPQTRKILIFSLGYFPKPVGGAEIAIKALTDRIDPHEIEFHLIALRYDSLLPKVERVGNVMVHRIGFARRGVDTAATHGRWWYLMKVLYVPLAVWHARRLHRIHRFDALWAQMVYMTFPISLARLVGMRVPYFISLQEGDPFARVFDRWFIRPVKPLLVAGIRNATVIQSISTYLASWVTERSYAGSVEVIPNGVDTERFMADVPDERVDEVRATLRDDDDELVLFTTSRLVHKNGIDTVIRALPLVLSRVRFAIAGTGPDLEMLRALAEELGVSERVSFLGNISQDELPVYYRASDIFIRPSRTEGQGISFIEAMAAGVPIIATQEGGIRDFLFDAVQNPDVPTTGWAVEVDDADGIAASVEMILRDPEATRRVTAQARTLVEERYDWDHIANDMSERVFARLFRSSGAGLREAVSN